MEETKYYWMSVKVSDMCLDLVDTEHPFIVVTKLRRNSSVRGLLNWKEFSKEDYILFQDILYNITKYVGEDDRPPITITTEKDGRKSN